ncbi:MAG: hypothetical protein JEZ11_26065 [Desulfobacterales bacterium]|nr:hypothetical protein [Desulfobacterales bacterium]
MTVILLDIEITGDGCYSSISREKRKRAGRDDKIPCVLAPELATRAFRRNRERLMQIPKREF